MTTRFKNRSKLEIVMEILYHLSRGVSKLSHLLLKCNMAHTQIQPYLDYLLSKSLVRVEQDGRRLYFISPEGLKALKTYREMCSNLNLEGLLLNSFLSSENKRSVKS